MQSLLNILSTPSKLLSSLTMGLLGDKEDKGAILKGDESVES